MVPLMITSAISYLINRSFQKHSIYTKALADKGELLSYEDKDTTVLSQMKLRYLIEKDYLQLQGHQLLSAHMNEILESKRNICAVLDEKLGLKGLIYVEEVFNQMMKNPDKDQLTADDLLHPSPAIVNISDDMKSVLQKMEQEQVWVLPVTDADAGFIGFVSKTSIFNKYRSLLRRQANYMD